MREILPGVFHWTSFHEGIAAVVHSYYVSAIKPAFLIDPRMLRQGTAWFEGRPLPEHIYLTNRHHYRHSRELAAAFDAAVWCHEEGLHEFRHGEQVYSFKHEDQLPGGVTALPIGVLCPEETAFLLPAHGGILAVGDAIVGTDHGLDFVPDELMGDDPAHVKRGLRRVFDRHLREQVFAHMLMAHGSPVLYRAHAILSDFVAGRGTTKHPPEAPTPRLL